MLKLSILILLKRQSKDVTQKEKKLGMKKLKAPSKKPFLKRKTWNKIKKIKKKADLLGANLKIFIFIGLLALQNKVSKSTVILKKEKENFNKVYIS